MDLCSAQFLQRPREDLFIDTDDQFILKKYRIKVERG